MPRTNPKRFERCVTKVKRSLKKTKRAGNAYAICKSTRSNPVKWNPLVPLDIFTASQIPTILSSINKQRQKFESKPKKKKNAVKITRGRMRRNSPESAKKFYADFHGHPSRRSVVVRTPIKYDRHVGALGDLRKLIIVTPDKRYRVTVRFTQKKGKPYPILSANKARNQLLIEGGDQSVNLKDFGITEPHEKEVLGLATNVHYFTTKDHLDPRDGGTAIYNHKYGSKHWKFGKKKTPLPTMIYDTRNGLIEFAGGGYTIPDEGIDG